MKMKTVYATEISLTWPPLKPPKKCPLPPFRTQLVQYAHFEDYWRMKVCVKNFSFLLSVMVFL